MSTDELPAKVVAAMQQAAISGLCLEGQLEIAAQTVREARPELGHAEALALATAVHKSRFAVDVRPEDGAATSRSGSGKAGEKQ